MARSGHEVWIDADEVALLGRQPPLADGGLIEALLTVGSDLLPSRAIHRGLPSGKADVSFAFGAAEARDAGPQIYLGADDWSASTQTEPETWQGGEWPLGGMAAGALAAGEAFKSAMRRLVDRARDGGYFSALHEPSVPCTVQLAPEDTPKISVLPEFDFISGDAIANAALFALYRVPSIKGRGRVIDDDTSALSNLNRNALLVRSALGMLKVRDLARFGHGISLEPVAARYRQGMSLADTVLVGVDDIPSRWAAQRQRPA